MKLLSYYRKGEVSFGIGKSNGLIDLGERLKNKLPAKTIINFLTFFGHDFLDKFVIDFSINAFGHKDTWRTFKQVLTQHGSWNGA